MKFYKIIPTHLNKKNCQTNHLIIFTILIKTHFEKTTIKRHLFKLDLITPLFIVQK